MRSGGGKKTAMTTERAEAIAAGALAFLASDPQRLVRFLSLTGLSPDELRQQADSQPVLTAVLDYLAGDESLLLVFAAGAGLAPEEIGPARDKLAGAPQGFYE
jgi:hypothetical protein